MVRKFPPFRSERKKRSTSEGTPQFPNGISGKLTSNRNFRIFLPNDNAFSHREIPWNSHRDFRTFFSTWKAPHVVPKKFMRPAREWMPRSRANFVSKVFSFLLKRDGFNFVRALPFLCDQEQKVNMASSSWYKKDTSCQMQTCYYLRR